MQVGLGVVLFLAGIVIAIGCAMSIGQMTTDLTATVRDFAVEVDKVADTVEKEQALCKAVENLLRETKQISLEISVRLPEYERDVAEVDTKAAAFLDDVGAFCDEWKNVPIPTKFEPKLDWSRRSFTLGKAVYLEGGKPACDAIRKALTQATSAMRAAVRLYANGHKKVVVATDLAINTAQRLQQKEGGLPDHVEYAHKASQQLGRVADRLEFLRPLLIGAGCLVVGIGVVCVINGMALLSVDARLKEFGAAQGNQGCSLGYGAVSESPRPR